MRTQPSSKAWRRYMRRTYRATGNSKAWVRWMMRRYKGQRSHMFNPADWPLNFGTDPEKWPKNRYQWRQQMGAKLLPYPDQRFIPDQRVIIGK